MSSDYDPEERKRFDIVSQVLGFGNPRVKFCFVGLESGHFYDGSIRDRWGKVAPHPPPLPIGGEGKGEGAQPRRSIQRASGTGHYIMLSYWDFTFWARWRNAVLYEGT